MARPPGDRSSAAWGSPIQDRWDDLSPNRLQGHVATGCRQGRFRSWSALRPFSSRASGSHRTPPSVDRLDDVTWSGLAPLRLRDQPRRSASGRRPWAARSPLLGRPWTSGRWRGRPPVVAFFPSALPRRGPSATRSLSAALYDKCANAQADSRLADAARPALTARDRARPHKESLFALVISGSRERSS